VKKRALWPPVWRARLFDPTSASRILDTRSGTGHSGPIPGGQSIDVKVDGEGPVPSVHVSAAVLNVTVTDTTAPSFLTVWPQGSPRLPTSNLNFSAGQTVPNRVIVPLGPTGEISILNAAGLTDVVADVGGWYTDGTDSSATGDFFTPAPAPMRILDTRNGTCRTGAIGPNSSIKPQVTGAGKPPIPADAAAVANLTVTDTTSLSYLRVFPDVPSSGIGSQMDARRDRAEPRRRQAQSGGAWNLYNQMGSTNAISGRCRLVPAGRDLEGWEHLATRSWSASPVGAGCVQPLAGGGGFP
jgi:hypothetical protein